MVASAVRSSSVKVCTWDRFALRIDGKSVGLDLVVTIFDEVSARSDCQIKPNHVIQ